MSTLEILHEKRANILELARRHGVTSVRVFGSVVRGLDEAASDIDLLVTVGTETTPWFPAGLILDLQALLGKQIEIVTERGLNPALRDSILSEAVPI
jgi:predicted nucleotidyltransferase